MIFNERNFSKIIFLVFAIIFLFSCQKEKKIPIKYFFETSKNIQKPVNNPLQLEFEENNHLDLGFYKGEVWIKLSVKNNTKPGAYIVLCNDLINQCYRFYKFENGKLKALKETNLAYNDHRTYRFSKPNFLVELEVNEKAIYYINTYSDGRILQATPNFISLEDFLEIKQQTRILDIVFYGFIAVLLFINLVYFRMIRKTIFYFYAAYILSGCLMYLFVEGRLYGLGLSHNLIDHLMFISIRLWILSGILFAVNFLDTKLTNPIFYRFIILFLLLSLSTTTVYQLMFSSSSISNLHQTENIIGFVWIIISIIIICVGFKKRKLESTYYFISYSLFLLFVTLGLIDSHTTVLPGDPFSYFKIGTLFEFLGFTYFISILIKNKLLLSNDLEIKLSAASKELQQKTVLLSTKKGIEKSDLVSITKLIENNLSSENEWEEFIEKFKKLNPTFLEKLIQRFPDLTKSETRLLILIKLGYSQKEIANILVITPDSVKKSRTRVRRKLYLNSDVELGDFLNKY